MDKDRLIKRLMATFLDELEEHVGALNRDLLALEKNPPEDQRAELLKTLFRTAHSLKGASRSVSVSLIEDVCHQFEEILTAARDGSAPLDSDRFALLFEAADAIEEAGMRLREEQDLGGSPLAALLPRLRTRSGVAERPSTPSPPPSGAAAAPPSPTPRTTPLLEPAPEVLAEDRRTRFEERASDRERSPQGPAIQDPQRSSQGPRSPAGDLPSSGPSMVGTEVPSGGPSGVGSVRVPAEKLDALLARSGELLVARRRVQLRVQDLAAVQELVGQCKAEWHTAEKLLGKLLRTQENVNGDGLPDRDAAGQNGLVSGRLARVLGRTGDHLRRLDKDMERLSAAMTGDGHLIKQATSALDDEVRRVRMLPFAEACQGLDRIVRDLAQASGKEVDVIVEGGSVELDRSVLEGLKDPLRHLVRNAVDHGVETPQERRVSGKHPRARITVAARLRGSQVEVVMSDDGRGLDLDALRQIVRKKQLPEPVDDRELAKVIFLPGFSTSRIITDISGRGVGLDVVKSRIEALHGTVDLASTPGHGTQFTLAVPLTLTMLRALLVEAGGQTFAFAGTNVLKLVRVNPGDFRSVEGREMLSLGGTPLPVAALAETLGLRSPEPVAAGGKAPVLVVAAGERRMAFIVDEFLAEQEIVIKSLGARICQVRDVSGATILPSGRIALVLNAANVIRKALSQAPGRAVATAPPRATPGGKKRVLVADDSVTTRTLEKSILEAAGYDVEVAVDGAAAWQVLQERGADLLVSDVDMPRMDGFGLTEAVRGSKRFRDLPVVLVTARESDRDKARGIEVGADAYLIKSAFEQKNLLETIAQLL